MYRSILLPIDGSQLSLRAARRGIELASALHARVTAILVTTPWATQFAREPAVVVPGVVVPQTEYDLRTEQAACNCLRVVTDEARSAGVRSKALHVRHRDPYVAIIDAARKEGCDLIVMASHGRLGLTELLLGSETVRVLTHSEIPVLVYRRP
ncbi:MAG TPA: universal stress protein [Hyphomicrobiaceae bacterium]|jgi:nucleotide-binding universal stress UspA family protein|nr:universal stress protein [Hyphomicrobiaceae bacterium]